MIRTVKSYIILALLALCALSASASPDKHDKGHRAQWEQQMRQRKIDFLAQELEMDKAQKEKFAAVYSQMDTELEEASRDLRNQSSELMRNGAKATDADYERLARQEFELRGRENRIEMKYYPKLKAILSPRQLFRLKHAERKFMRRLMEEHKPGEGRGGKRRSPQKSGNGQ